MNVFVLPERYRRVVLGAVLSCVVLLGAPRVAAAVGGGRPPILFTVTGNLISGGPFAPNLPEASIQLNELDGSPNWSESDFHFTYPQGSITTSGSAAGSTLTANFEALLDFTPACFGCSDWLKFEGSVNIYVLGSQQPYSYIVDASGSVDVENPEGCTASGPRGTARVLDTSVTTPSNCAPVSATVLGLPQGSGTSSSLTQRFAAYPCGEYSLAASVPIVAMVYQEDAFHLFFSPRIVARLTATVTVTATLDAPLPMCPECGVSNATVEFFNECFEAPYNQAMSYEIGRTFQGNILFSGTECPCCEYRQYATGGVTLRDPQGNFYEPEAYTGHGEPYHQGLVEDTVCGAGFQSCPEPCAYGNRSSDLRCGQYVYDPPIFGCQMQFSDQTGYAPVPSGWLYAYDAFFHLSVANTCTGEEVWGMSWPLLCAGLADGIPDPPPAKAQSATQHSDGDSTTAAPGLPHQPEGATQQGAFIGTHLITVGDVTARVSLRYIGNTRLQVQVSRDWSGPIPTTADELETTVSVSDGFQLVASTPPLSHIRGGVPQGVSLVFLFQMPSALPGDVDVTVMIGTGSYTFSQTLPSPMPAGRTPDASTLPGTPLTIAKGPAPQITLSWGGSCVPTDTDYEVYEGTLGDFGSHVPRFCSTAGNTQVTITPSFGGLYYIVVPRTSINEGSYGTNSLGQERSRGSGSCFPQSLTSCP